ncbi:Rho termination factor N-terminal domain-containing protein [Paraconexibacter algicola]|uniref:Rho termination factor-like N-terminal domain-containing protein n=1 Tax=Paraconexibacter algicola TaxID=2133960 RepID=A0A2T4UED1_9ACTN|nr:Rho termination factor N-terminal domain-containing protein [Paraconexibacter algicola]PTL56150.1 hypothetical protein C7Y72_14245 [Paraconexibacter algicola]
MAPVRQYAHVKVREVRRDRTRDELYDEARELGVDGRSNMTKDELVRSIAGRKAARTRATRKRRG